MRSPRLEKLLDVLGYSESKNYRPTDGEHDPATAHLFRSANDAGAEGAYVFHTSPNDEILPPRAAVYVAEADTLEEARRIHRRLWNLGNAPFIIILLPNQVRVYTGFSYARENDKRGLVDVIDILSTIDLGNALANYSADSIDSGRLWKDQADKLTPEFRVDTQLLKNLTKLEEALNKKGLDIATAHALIGKYVYIRYLYDRNILSPQWLEEHNVDIGTVLGREATLKGLRKLVEALDDTFNGHIFPFPLRGKNAPDDEHVSLVASAFKGDDPLLRQLHLDFEAYDFSYIPIETLSSIYEQFLHAQGKGKVVGAVYTPEPVADYLIAELNHHAPLKKGMKILDPCCGSGIFLVLAYRKLIELELRDRPEKKLRPTELREILTKSIYGVERNPDACFVTELSLILTMLHYIEPPELHRNKQFKFPVLHNEQIFESDFFDDNSVFWAMEERFDWIIGNPPWIEPSTDSKDEKLAVAWIEANSKHRPVAGNRVSEAFSWRVVDLAKPDGCIGLLLHAKSLFNHESEKYRKKFFKQHDVTRITDFSNLAYVLFGGRGEAPAATMIYRKSQLDRERPSIIHYGPFLINQVSTKPWEQAKRQPTWVLTINESEIQTIAPEDAEKGLALTWKLALWGSHRDERALQRLQRLFPLTLEQLKKIKGWNLFQGILLMEDPRLGAKNKYKAEAAPELEGKKYLDADAMAKSGLRFSVPSYVLRDIPSWMCFLRKRSGDAGLKIAKAPHLVLNAAYFAYSDEDFHVRSPHTALSVPSRDADHLRALSAFLSSSIVQYYLFFQSPSWGIDRTKIFAKDIKKIPVPDFSAEQIEALAELQRKLSDKETSATTSDDELQKTLDDEIERVLKVPKNLSVLARDFTSVRLSLNKGKVSGAANDLPQSHDLHNYGQLLRDELDKFAKGRVRHRVSIIYSYPANLVACSIELVDAQGPIKVSVRKADSHADNSLTNIQEKLKQQFSQWVYIQRGLHIFDGSQFHLCKSPRLIDWTRTQALNDSDDIIAEVLAGLNTNYEVVMNGA